ncbi:anti-sigma factor family protein [Mycolicibacterium palauense]|uniref:anti-sigma factor family protein n=1 Tax=Mycolicibacterium palauense TaxID=2034511 RepID=UPI000BFEF82E|nr:hypothetical protein [Mycolicibacterium palauense]
MTDDNLAEWDAAYILGALDAQDRRTYEAYLAENPDRAAELAELTELPALLEALPQEEALGLLEDPVEPTTEHRAEARADLLPSLAAAAAKRDRRTRRTVLTAAVAAAAAMLIIGGIVGATVFPGSAPVTQTVAMQDMTPGPRGGITAQLAVTEKKWGTELSWSCEYTKAWARDIDSYDLVVTTVDGRQTTVGSWRPAGDEATGLSAATSIPTPEIRAVDIRVTGASEALATLQT